MSVERSIRIGWKGAWHKGQDSVYPFPGYGCDPSGRMKCKSVLIISSVKIPFKQIFIKCLAVERHQRTKLLIFTG